jgi:hypothetical protein
LLRLPDAELPSSLRSDSFSIPRACIGTCTMTEAGAASSRLGGGSEL